jgi:hypothetical protein
MNEDEPTPNAALPDGYRSGFLTAITVFLGFSLSFLRFWSLEKPGEWTGKGIISAGIVTLGIGVQLFALFRSLDVRDNDRQRYSVTVRYFFVGVLVVAVGVIVAIFVAT